MDTIATHSIIEPEDQEVIDALQIVGNEVLPKRTLIQLQLAEKAQLKRTIETIRVKCGWRLKDICEEVGINPLGYLNYIDGIDVDRVELAQKCTYIHSPEFENPKNRAVILAPAPNAQFLAAEPEALLTSEQEQQLFRQMNYLLYIATQKLQTDATPTGLIQAQQSYATAQEICADIVQRNVRLVVSTVQGICGVHLNLEDSEEFSEANMTLLNAVRKFDYTRGFKFSTYAVHAMRRTLFNMFRKTKSMQERLPTTTLIEDTVQSSQSSGKPMQHLTAALYDRVREVMLTLDEREQYVIQMRFGLVEDAEPQVLREVGADLGVTKERVRQVETAALAKLRRLLQGEAPDL